MGAFDAQRAAGVFSQTLMLAIGLGAAIYAAMTLGETAFLDMTGVTGVVRLILRDNGKPLANSLGKYLNTLGCNRTECRFDIMAVK